MGRNKKLNTQDYEAAFLFNHFVNSCHEKAAGLLEDEYLNSYIFPKRLGTIKNQKILSRRDYDEYYSNRYRELSTRELGDRIESDILANRMGEAYRGRNVEPREPSINYYKLFGECEDLGNDQGETSESNSGGYTSGGEHGTVEEDTGEDYHSSIETEGDFPHQGYGYNEDIKNRRYSSTILNDKENSKNRAAVSSASSKNKSRENRKDKTGFICGYCLSKFYDLKALAHHMEECHKTK